MTSGPHLIWGLGQVRTYIHVVSFTVLVYYSIFVECASIMYIDNVYSLFHSG